MLKLKMFLLAVLLTACAVPTVTPTPETITVTVPAPSFTEDDWSVHSYTDVTNGVICYLRGETGIFCLKVGY